MSLTCEWNFRKRFTWGNQNPCFHWINGWKWYNCAIHSDVIDFYSRKNSVMTIILHIVFKLSFVIVQNDSKKKREAKITANDARTYI